MINTYTTKTKYFKYSSTTFAFDLNTNFLFNIKLNVDETSLANIFAIITVLETCNNW